MSTPSSIQGSVGRLGPLHFDATPSAQRYRRQRLQPDAIRAHLLDWKARDPFGASFAATGLIEMAEMLQTTTSEFTEIVGRVMGILREINDVYRRDDPNDGIGNAP